MTILDRYFTRRLLITLARAIISMVLMFILVDLLTSRRNDIARYDIPWSIVFEYYLAFIPQLLCKFQLASLAMLISVLLVFGEAAQNNEITAALAGGISLRRIIRVPVVIALILTGLLFALEDTLGAVASREVERLDARYFSKNAQRERPSVSWANLADDWTCHVMKFNRTAGTGENVFLHRMRPDSVEQIQARRIYWEPAQKTWILEDGLWFTFDPHQDWQGIVTRITQRAAPIKETPDELFALDEPSDGKTIRQLADDIHRAEARGVPVFGAQTDYYAKFAQPVLCFVMIWLAIPFAMRLRRGGIAIGFGVSIAIALAYVIVFRVSMGLGHFEKLSPVVAAWFANVLFLAVGFVLFRKTPT